MVLEAFASGKPAIVSSLPGPAAIVTNGKDGLVARAGDPESLRDQILLLHHNKVLRETMGKAGYEKIKANYTWAAVAETLENAFFRMLLR